MTDFLIIGTGFLGKHLFKILKQKKMTVVGTVLNNWNTEFERLDVTDLSETRNLLKKINPKILVNCAAITDVDLLEKNKELAFSVNAEGAENLAIVSNEQKIRMIHVSTDGIFDGAKGNYTEDDRPNPINIYGKSKLSGEIKIKKNLDNFSIIRTNFFGLDYKQKTLLNWILDNLNKKNKIKGFEDVFFSPLSVSNLSELIIELSHKPDVGIINLASDEKISKYQFIMKTCKIFGLDQTLIDKISLDEMDFVAKRPKDTSLSNLKAKKLFKTIQLPIEKSLQKIVHKN